MPASPALGKIRFIATRLAPHKGKAALLFALLAAGIALQVYSPRYLQLFIDQAKEGRDLSVLATSAALFLLLTTLRQVATVAAQSMTGKLTWDVTNRLRLELTRLCLDRGSEFHKLHPPGELLERIDGDVGRLNNFLSAFALKVVGNHLLVAAAAAAVWIIHPVVGAVVAALTAAALIVLHGMGGRGTRTVRRYLAESADLLGYMEERMAGREDIRALDAAPHALAVYYERLRSVYRTRRRTGTVLGLTLNAGEVTLAAVTAGTLLCLGLVALNGADLSIGTMFLVHYYVAMLLVPLRNIVAEMSDLQQAGAALHRIGELFGEAQANDNTARAAGRRAVPDGPVSVRFENVTFGYEKTNPVVREFSLHVPAGRSVGIVGKTGSGKSTVAKLLFRLYEPQQGTITIGGADIRQFDTDAVGARIAYVPQSVELFEGSLRDNITMFDDSVEDERIHEALRLLHMEAWLSRFPEGLDKPIGMDGHNVSAGEAQLIAFARAFLKRPDIVIMDEATSRIDPETERTIGAATETLLRGRTAIVIAHKLETLAATDYILVMRDGKAVEFGETRSPSRDPAGVYAKLLREAGENE
ncbi:ABC transporter ATP-binding protein [Paenibacillus sp. GYB003]|uniref:ABC transporter ATP-binding protein n=1 Tax=Paenibacillus sp. GYB003 TaxID=2994392 RepID=UPI002F969EFB